MLKDSDSDRLLFYLDLADGAQDLYGQAAAYLKDAFRDMVRMFNELGVHFVLFGAHAVALYVSERRTTQDIDVVTGEENMDRVRKHASRYGFSELPKSEDAIIRTFRHHSGVAFQCK